MTNPVTRQLEDDLKRSARRRTNDTIPILKMMLWTDYRHDLPTLFMRLRRTCREGIDSNL